MAVEIAAPAGTEPRRRGGALRTLLKNVVALTGIAGTWLAVETGYFSNDRTSRVEWNEMERLKAKSTPRIVYEASFNERSLADRSSPVGFWDFYNGATAETASIENGALEVRFTATWIGAYFRHLAFQPNGVYRVRFEARVEEQPGAILMRNRQLDLMREQIPVTGGEFKEFSHVYVAPGGRWDHVRVIFIPDARNDAKGRMTIRKFRIEKLED